MYSEPGTPRNNPLTSPPAGWVLRRALLLCIILVAFACQTYRLAGQSLWYDEAVTARVAEQGLAELTRWTADDIQPPLYYYVVAGWTHLAGRGEWALRFPSVFFATLLVPLLWALARRLFGSGRAGSRAALLAALLVALSPLYTYYAQEARMYTLLAALGVLAGYCLLRAMAQPAGSGQVTPENCRAVVTGAAPGADPTFDPKGRLRAGAGPPRLRRGGRGSGLSSPEVVDRRPGLKRDAATLPVTSSEQATLGWWVAFALVAAASLYTHYFAAFLLLAYALYFLLVWTIRVLQGVAFPAWRGLGTAAISGMAVVVLYLPWLPAMLNRLRVDRSYWQGALKLDEAVRHVAISYTMAATETTLESVAMRWLPWFGLAFALCLAALLWWRWQPENMVGLAAQAGETGRPRPLLFLLLTLAVPILGVLALASRTPKFNPRYLMLASPAYLLILAGGLGVLFSAGDRARPRWLVWSGFASGIAALALLVILPGQAQQRWLSGDPSFTKAQWRELAAAVRQQIAPDEAVLLVSGHAAPAWDYYAPDLPATRLPDIDILDVQAVLGFDSGPAMAQALAGKSGAWVVFWQDQAVDPMGFVPYYLDRAGTEVPVPGQYWQLRLRHWRLQPAAAYPDHAEPQHPDGANFAHKIALLGWDDVKSGQVTLYWQALNTIGARDYQVSLHFEDASGREIPDVRWDGRPAGYDYPTDRWQPGRSFFGRYPLPKNLLPGQYFLTVALYDATQPSGLDIMDVADNPAGKRVRLGPITVGP